MIARALATLLAAALVVAYLAPVVFKLKDIALTAVVALGLVLMAVDLWQSIRERPH